MNLSWHIAKNDARRLWILLLLWGLLLAGQSLLIGAGVKAVSENFALQMALGMVEIFIPIIELLMVMFVASILVLGDPAVGTSAFWMTRPISRISMFRGKLLFVSLFILIPVVVMEVLVLAVNGATPLEVLLGGLEAGMIAFSSALMGIAFATLCEGVIQLVIGVAINLVVSLTLGFAVAAIAMYVNGLGNTDQLQNLDSYYIGQIFSLIISILFSAGFAIYQYYYRNQFRGIVIYVGYFILCIVIGLVMQFGNFKVVPEKTESALAKNVEFYLLPTTQVMANSESNPFNFSLKGGSSMNLSGEFYIHHLPKDVQIQATQSQGTVTLRDGKVIPVTKSIKPNFNLTVDEKYVRGVLGDVNILSTTFSYRSYYNDDIGTVSSADGLKMMEVGSGTLNLDMVFKTLRYRVEAEIPAKMGETWVDGAKSVRVQKVLGNKKEVEVILRERSICLLFRGDLPAVATMMQDGSSYVLINRKRNEVLIQDYSPNIDIFGAASMQRLHHRLISLKFTVKNNSNVEITDEWLKDASIVHISSVDEGIIHKSVKSDAFFNSSNDKTERKTQARQITIPEIKSDQELTTAVLNFPATLMNHDVELYNQNLHRLKDGAVGRIGRLIDMIENSGIDRKGFVMDVIDEAARPEDKDLILSHLSQTPALLQVVHNHKWEKDAQDILVKKLKETPAECSIDVLRAIASFKNPELQPLLIKAVEVHATPSSALDAISNDPGINTAAVVDATWKHLLATTSSDDDAVIDFIPLAIRHGHEDALLKAALILKVGTSDNHKDDSQLLRDAILSHTDAEAKMSDSALAEWVLSRDGKLKWDAAKQKFLETQTGK